MKLLLLLLLLLLQLLALIILRFIMKHNRCDFMSKGLLGTHKLRSRFKNERKFNAEAK
ncbi:hypothetical protein DPMN_163001 [Dreissena polymorpha]|uniref:Uncharacterized protein n=1 Tax=Dreissena polymorpha TaxID=45954 RepID=A0A9D4ESQ2_DREPO|nr:hypothetical protein DPMN_163001 [Dreissena polymorpha]